MNTCPNDGTTLLRCIKDPSDRDAWEAFVDRYAPSLYTWCLQRGLESADAEDVTRDVLTRLYRGLRRIECDCTGTFRDQLQSAAKAAVRDFCSTNRARAAALGNAAAQEALCVQLDEVYAQEVLDEARFRVQQRMAADTWHIYRQTIAGEQPDTIAASTGVATAAIVKTKSEVEARIRAEVDKLIDLPDTVIPDP